MSAAPPGSIAIASGKGGVGKTWLAITLAHALARLGRRVAAVRRRSRPGQCGRAAWPDSAARPGHGDRRVGDAGAGGAAPPGRRLRHSGRPVRQRRAVRRWTRPHWNARWPALREASSVYDAALLDLGAGVERPVRRMAAFADLLLVVATEEPTSLTDAYAVLKLHAADRRRRRRAHRRQPGDDAERPANAPMPPCTAPARRSCTAIRHWRASSGATSRVRDAIRRQALLLTRHPGCPAAAGRGGDRARPAVTFRKATGCPFLPRRRPNWPA